MGLVLVFAASAATAAEPPAGAVSCSGCHSPTPLAGTSVPPLYGRKADELLQAMAEFRSGKRQATVMDRLMKGFSEDEMKSLATWLAEQK